MRRFLLVLFAGLLFNVEVSAQQTGEAGVSDNFAVNLTVVNSGVEGWAGRILTPPDSQLAICVYFVPRKPPAAGLLGGIRVEPPPAQIRIIPGLPNPDSPGIYCLQIGSYAAHDTADIMAQKLRAAGLQAGVERYNSLLRVFVPDVRAADAGSTALKLGQLGFNEVWIRE